MGQRLKLTFSHTEFEAGLPNTVSKIKQTTSLKDLGTKDFSEPYNRSISIHLLLLFSLHLDLRQVRTATRFKIHCYYNSYNEAVISTSPQPESHLLQTQFFS